MTAEASPENRVDVFFTSLAGRLRPVKRIFCGLVLAVIAIEALSFVSLWAYGVLRKGQQTNLGSPEDPRQNLDVYADADWVEAYFEEFAASYGTDYHSYTHYRRWPYSGLYINIDDDGLRRTVPDCGAGRQDALRIFFLGGSAAWGTGARDEYTIPSLLARRLCGLGLPATVTNFGESGYTNTQELLQLQLELRHGHVPALAVFYDGVNDVYSSYQNGEAGLPQNVANRRVVHKLSQKSEGLQRLFQIALLTNSGQIAKKTLKQLMRRRRAGEAEAARSDSAALDRATVGTILANMRIVGALEQEYGFRTFLYWQPTIYNKDVLSADETGKIKKDEAYGRMYLRVTDLVRQEEAIVDLSEILHEHSRTFFIDEFHVSEEGNRIVAGRIAEDILSWTRSTGRWLRGEG